MTQDEEVHVVELDLNNKIDPAGELHSLLHDRPGVRVQLFIPFTGRATAVLSSADPIDMIAIYHWHQGGDGDDQKFVAWLDENILVPEYLEHLTMPSTATH